MRQTKLFSKRVTATMDVIRKIVNDLFTNHDITQHLRGSLEFAFFSGSVAYGLNDEKSDFDLTGFYIPSRETIYNIIPFKSQQTYVVDTEYGQLLIIVGEDQFKLELIKDSERVFEGTFYDIRKMLTMWFANNPNALEILWVDPEFFAYNKSSLISSYRNHRTRLFSPRIVQSYIGYSFDQIKRMDTHRKWLIGEVPSLPTREEYNLPEESIFPTAQRESVMNICVANNLPINTLDSIHGFLSAEFAYQVSQIDHSLTRMMQESYSRTTKSWLHTIHSLANLLPDNLRQMAQQELKYYNAMSIYKSYMEWKNSRNQARAEIEAAVGYDAKHGSQVVRLLTVCKEILSDSRIHVNRRTRGDAQFMINCKRAKVEYDEWKRVVNRLKTDIEELKPSANRFNQYTKPFIEITQNHITECLKDE